MPTTSAPSEMAFFTMLARLRSFSAAARELDITTAAVSRRLTQMETRIGVQLLHRTTRRVGLTPEGEVYLAHARRILSDIESMEELVAGAATSPRGLLRVNATPGFGRSNIAPLIARFAKRHPDIQIQLQLTVNPPSLGDDAFDVCVRFGEPPDARVIARRLAANRRLLCASPTYLGRAGTPQAPDDLARHAFIGIRQGDEGYGVLHLRQGKRTQSVKVHGNLSSNDGEIAVNWALGGHGIVLRAEWDIAKYLRSGRLVQVLPRWDTPPADIYAIYPQRHHGVARVRAFVDFLCDAFADTAAAGP